VWTNTYEDGTAVTGANSCSDWSDLNANSTVPNATMCGDVYSQGNWSAATGCGTCNGTAALYCFEQDVSDLGPVDAGVPEVGEAGTDSGPPSYESGPKTVFVTSQIYTGDLGGLLGADAKCQSLATAAHLTGTYRAWLADVDGSPSTRFSREGHPYHLVDGTLVADDWTDLTSGNLRHAIDLTETGGPPPASVGICDTSPEASRYLVWTETGPDGSGGGDACGEWTDSLSEGSAVGGADMETSGWTLDCFGGIACSGRAALYCFQQ
jgi:hypothetical protein